MKIKFEDYENTPKDIKRGLNIIYTYRDRERRANDFDLNSRKIAIIGSIV